MNLKLAQFYGFLAMLHYLFVLVCKFKFDFEFEQNHWDLCLILQLSSSFAFIDYGYLLVVIHWKLAFEYYCWMIFLKIIINVAIIVIKDDYFEEAEYHFKLLHFDHLINSYLINLDLIDWLKKMFHHFHQQEWMNYS